MAATETLKTTYEWSDFDLTAALAGSLVGIKPVGSLADDGIGRNVGKLRKNTSAYYARYVVTLNSNICYVDEDGIIQHCSSDSSYIGKPLKMCNVTLAVTSGSQQSTTRAPSTGEYKETIALSSLEVRDTFAMYALQSLLSRCEDNPIYFDDSNILNVCEASYRWAQGMMQASANARALIESDEGGIDEGNEDEAPRYEVNVTDGTNTEKLLSNLISAVDDLTTQTKKLREDGLMVSGSTKSATAVKVEASTKITEIPNVSINNANWATSSELSAAERNIISAMPSCRYTPPTNNESD